LADKTLEARFVTEVTQGLNCSPFEAKAVLGVVQEVFAPLWREASSLPGRTVLMAVDADEPAGKSVKDCQKRLIILHVHRGEEDDRVLQRGGPRAFRRARLPDLCQVALSQGGLLTAEDLAYRVFFVTPRTISRDLAALRKAEPGRMIPMRSTVHDLGPVLTHRTQIVRLALEGKTTTEICRRLKHSPEAVANYVSTFTRVAQLAQRGSQAGEIAFLLRRGPALVRKYLELLEECRQDRNLAYHLQELLRVGQAGGGKKTAGRSRHG
jgi:DNA-binding CsgD family transcriptional regulator/DNA-binding transcriptional ArsR family regulator